MTYCKVVHHRPTGTLIKRTPTREHALALLEFCRARGIFGRVLYNTVSDAYAEMCAERGIAPLGWNGVAAHFNSLTGGKTFAWVHSDVDHQQHRLRVYTIEPVRPLITQTHDDDTEKPLQGWRL
jgi:hypothetical protein